MNRDHRTKFSHRSRQATSIVVADPRRTLTGACCAVGGSALVQRAAASDGVGARREVEREGAVCSDWNHTADVDSGDVDGAVQGPRQPRGRTADGVQRAGKVTGAWRDRQTTRAIAVQGVPNGAVDLGVKPRSPATTRHCQEATMTTIDRPRTASKHALPERHPLGTPPSGRGKSACSAAQDGPCWMAGYRFAGSGPPGITPASSS